MMYLTVLQNTLFKLIADVNVKIKITLFYILILLRTVHLWPCKYGIYSRAYNNYSKTIFYIISAITSFSAIN